MKLSSFSAGRDNNFNLIRSIAALSVLVSHSFALAIGTGDAEPFESLGMTLGSIAVDVFFITSGFLVTASLLTRQSTIEFVWARVLRIFPALLVMLLLTVFVLGVFFTSLPLSSYFSDFRTYAYLAKCSTLLAGAAYQLPGVFDSNPYKNTVNGSLWTLPYEVRMYAILAAIWLALRITQKYRLKIFKLSIVTYAALSGIYVLASHFYFPTISYFAKFSFMFFTGAAFYVLKEHIFISRSLFWFIVIAFSAIGNKNMFYVVDQPLPHREVALIDVDGMGVRLNGLLGTSPCAYRYGPAYEPDGWRPASVSECAWKKGTDLFFRFPRKNKSVPFFSTRTISSR